MEMEIDDCSVENGGNEEDSRNDSESDHDNQPNISHSIVTHTGEDMSVPSNATGDALLADNLSDVQQNILNIQNHVNATYKKHQVYDSFDALRDHMKPMATGFGFVLRRKGQSIVCNRAWRTSGGPPPEQIDPIRETDQNIPCGCNFKISFDYCEKQLQDRNRN
ncbi:hypothetical protein FisN_21Hu001 [Fistulifera solaris]|uniref:Uncharacterized protein n=1 Tax=Fistulifera solaris TaxID=1519565 RepID=A0A1Z5KAL9_FISSO|nr:hypothetical protein FisN_21Hu001 [Fistulifera solaris]|eukprot:GAX23313.1 hypothetical protein FisN_21Hu001 [Fistulifera solaris]